MIGLGLFQSLTPFILPSELRSIIRSLYQVAVTEQYNQTQTARYLGTNRRTLQRAIESDFQSLRESTMLSMIERMRVGQSGEFQQTGRFSQRLDTKGYGKTELQSVLFPEFRGQFPQKINVVRTSDPRFDETPDYVTDSITTPDQYYRYIQAIDTEDGPMSGSILSVTAQYKGG